MRQPVWHGDRDHAVSALREAERPLGGVDDRRACDYVEALLERVHVPGDRASGVELADHETRVHGMIVFAHRRTAAVARRSPRPPGGGSDELDRIGGTYQVASAHCRFSTVASRR